MNREVKVTIALFLTAMFLIGWCIGGYIVAAEASPDRQVMEQYASEVALQYDLAPELVCAVIEVESSWNPRCANSRCVGLMQLNIDTAPGIAKALGISGDRYDWKQNIQMGCYQLNYLRDYWLSKGATDEDCCYLILISYNRGIGGATKWLKSHAQEDNGYAKKVLGIKYRLEGMNG